MGSDIQQCLAANDLVAFRWLGLVNEADASGRRLSEGAAPAQIQSTREMEYVACPYGDTRSSAKKPMNRSALVSMTSCWDRLCDWSRAVAVAYGKREGVVRTTFLDVWRVAAALRTAWERAFVQVRPAEPSGNPGIYDKFLVRSGNEEREVVYSQWTVGENTPDQHLMELTDAMDFDCRSPEENGRQVREKLANLQRRR